MEDCDDGLKIALLNKLLKLSQMSWQAIQTAPKHGLGSEKIPISSLPNIKYPDLITEDVTHLLALRYDGMKPMVGFRNKYIFHIILIDKDFNLYNH